MTSEVQNDSGLPLKPVYSVEDRGADEPLPGTFPFTRGIHQDMYRGRLWTMRQYAGFGTAAESNKRYRFLLDQGQTGLSVAFDLPTQIGYDSDDPMANGEVGKVGVAAEPAGDNTSGMNPDVVSNGGPEGAVTIPHEHAHAVVKEVRRDDVGDAVAGQVGHDEWARSVTDEGIPLVLEGAVAVPQEYAHRLRAAVSGDEDARVEICGDDVGDAVAIHVGNLDCPRSLAGHVVHRRLEGAVAIAQPYAHAVVAGFVVHDDVVDAVASQVADRDSGGQVAGAIRVVDRGQKT